MFNPVDKSNIKVVVSDIATKMVQIKNLQEDIKEAAKGIAEKYKDEITAQDIKTLAKLSLVSDDVEEKQENAQKPYDLYDIIMR